MGKRLAVVFVIILVLGLVVLGLLAIGPVAAALAALGAALPIVWAFSPVIGLGGGLVVAAVVLVPAYVAGSLMRQPTPIERVQATSFVARDIQPVCDGVEGDVEQFLQPAEGVGQDDGALECRRERERAEQAECAEQAAVHVHLPRYYDLCGVLLAVAADEVDAGGQAREVVAAG